MTAPLIWNVLNGLPFDPPLNALKMHGAATRGLELLETADGALGADVIWVPRGEAFPVHAHPSDHLLLCIAGRGSISVGREVFRVGPGDLYLVPGRVPHAVGATPDSSHTLISIGAPHLKVDSPTRMQPVAWDGRAVEVPLASDGYPVCFREDGCSGELVGYVDTETLQALIAEATDDIERHGPGCPRAPYRVAILVDAANRLLDTVPA